MENQQQRQPSMKSRFRRVCVFCGSSPGKNPNYQHAAIQLGKQLVCYSILLPSTCYLVLTLCRNKASAHVSLRASTWACPSQEPSPVSRT